MDDTDEVGDGPGEPEAQDDAPLTPVIEVLALHADAAPERPSHLFQPGNPGRQPGTQNKLTKTFKAALMATFHEIGGVEHLTAWARLNPTEFYKIAARLIPTEVVGPGENGAHVIKRIVDEHRP